jgi:uncharacterized protein (DUF1697 family)
MDTQLYEHFKDFCARLYIPVSAMLSALAAKAVRDDRVELDDDPFYSKANMKWVKSALQEANQDKFATKATASQFDDLIASL